MFLPLVVVSRLVYLMSFAAFIQLAAMIPRSNPIAQRHPALIPGNYAAGAVLALGAVAGSLGPLLPKIRWQLSIPAFQVAIGVTYLYAGVLGLVLLSSAALHEPTATGRRQAFIVFFGLLPWTLNLAGWLLLPAAIYPFSLFRTVEPLVILLVPVSFLLAIFGFRLFEVGSIVRTGLIYGFTTGVLAAVLYVSMARAGALAGRALGVRFGAWNSALLLVLTGAALGPLLRRVTQAVDVLFFPEKVALRRLQKSVIPVLAGSTGIDAAALQLVSWVREGLVLKNASLLIADESRRFYRVRALAGEFDEPKAREAVLTGGDLEDWLAAAGPRTRRTERLFSDASGELGELRGMLALLEAREAIPLRFSSELVGLLVLGPSPSHSEFDGDDLRRLEDVARQAAAMLENARLFDLATRDPLTGLPRRQVFEERLAQELERSRRSFEPFAIGLADIDGFKRVNDSRGHLAGDQVLRALAAVLTQETRRSDMVARYGGEEFAFLFAHAAHEGMLHLAEALRRKIEGQEIDVEGGVPISITISLGIHVLRPEDVTGSAEDLVRYADRALYEAKRLGKNRVAVYG